MNPRAALAGWLWKTANRPEARRLAKALHRPRETQAARLQQYLARNADTAFGRAHGFARTRDPAEYQQRVPLADYDDLAPWIERVAAGEPAVLTRAPVLLLEVTSGSTAAAKLIPYTADLQAEFTRAVAAWFVDLCRRAPGIEHGPAYWSISPVAQQRRRSPGGLPIGFEEDSAYLGGAARRLVDALMAVPGDVRHICDVDAFRYVTLLFLLRCRELRLVSVWHPSFLTLLLDALRAHWPRLLDDIARGTLHPPTPPEPGVAARLARRLAPSPRRARELARLTPDATMRIWPQLRLISCWADAHAALYADELARRFPGVQVQPKGLIATEGFITLPLGGAFPLALRSHYFEFLRDDGAVSLAHELETGGEYRVVLSTGGGLYRYRLGDRVRVETRLFETPSLRFLGRGGLASDRFGEKLAESFVARVLRTLLADERPAFAMLAPEQSAAGWRYVLYLEPAAPPDRDPPDAARRSDAACDTVAAPHAHAASRAARLEALLAENPHYRYCRHLGQLQSADVCLVPPRAYERYTAHCQSFGQRLGDIKPAALSVRDGWRPVLVGAPVAAGT
ncbi:MAG: GH3 auxin-responsive promoter family protein [Phycisphaerae bacterium]